MLVLRTGAGLAVVSADSNWVRAAPDTVAPTSVGLAPSNPGSHREGSKFKGWPLPVSLLVGEASIAALASSGHISDLAGEPPESGAYVLGSGLAALGAIGTMFVPWALADANTHEDRRGVLTLLVGCVGVMSAGGYDL